MDAERRVFGPRDTLRATVRYHAPVRIHDPVFGFSFIRHDGTICTWSRTKFDGITIPWIEGEGSFTIELSPLRLTAGLYTFFVGIFDRSDAAHYDIHQQATFVVEDPDKPMIDPMLGVFTPDVKWDIPLVTDGHHSGARTDVKARSLAATDGAGC
jgi:hypothetical protein